MNTRQAYPPNGLEPNGIHYPDSNVEHHSRAESISGSSLASIGLESSLLNRFEGNLPGNYGTTPFQLNRQHVNCNGTNEHQDVKFPKGGMSLNSNQITSDTVDDKDSGPLQNGESGLRSRDAVQAAISNQNDAEWIEQYEPGVYITLMALQDGTRDLKRVRFR